MLEKYLNDPNCLTSMRQEINKRLKGIETFGPGTIAPNIVMHNSDNRLFELNNYQNEKPYLLVIFWSAGCGHCVEMVEKLSLLFQREEIRQNLDIIAISLDETDIETEAWQQKIKELNGWIHLQAHDGVRSKVANDYYILGIPVMILLNVKSKEIISLPENIDVLNEYFKLK